VLYRFHPWFVKHGIRVRAVASPSTPTPSINEKSMLVRTDLGVVKQDVEDIKETARLIEGRLVRLEKHAGLVKA
jgi:hypothetical protein